MFILYSTMQCECLVRFDSNYASFGGAMSVYGSDLTSFDGTVVFTNNSCNFTGGAVAVYLSQVSFTCSAVIDSNYARLRTGGAIQVYSTCHSGYQWL